MYSIEKQSIKCLYFFCLSCCEILYICDMENSNTPVTYNIEEDFDVIRKKKIEHHISRLAFHKQQLEKLGVLSGGLINTPSVKTDAATSYDKSWWWEENIVRLSDTKLGGKEFSNSDLIKAENVPNLSDQAYKKKVVYAVSIALRNLINKGELEKRKKRGIKGYLYTTTL